MVRNSEHLFSVGYYSQRFDYIGVLFYPKCKYGYNQDPVVSRVREAWEYPKDRG